MQKNIKTIGLILGIILLIFIIVIISIVIYVRVTKQDLETNTISTTDISVESNKETNPKYSDAFMENFKNTYIKGCIGDNPAKDAFCGCSYTSLMTKFGFEGFMQKSLEYKKTKQMDPEFLGAVAGCVGLMPSRQQ